MPKTTPSLRQSSGWRVIASLKWSLREWKHLTNTNCWRWPVVGRPRDTCLPNPCQRRALTFSLSPTGETPDKLNRKAWHARQPDFDASRRDDSVPEMVNSAQISVGHGTTKVAALKVAIEALGVQLFKGGSSSKFQDRRECGGY